MKPNEIVEIIARDFPDTWKLCHPRRILPPTGFVNPKLYSAAIWSHVRLWSDNQLVAQPHFTTATSSMALIASGVPTYFVDPEFSRAVARTRIPEGLRLSDLRWPLASMLLCLHPSFAKEFFGYDVPFISLSRLPAGNYPDCLTKIPWGRFFGHGQGLTYTSDRMNIVGYFIISDPSFPTEYSGTYPLHADLNSVKDAPFSDATPSECAQLGIAVPTGGTTEEEDRTHSERLLSFAVKMLLVLSAAPRTVRSGGLARPIKLKKGRVVQEELWHPNVIGFGYRISNKSAPNHGTHAAPGFHIRWGHFTHQVKGSRGPDFVSTSQLPKKADGQIDWSRVDEDTRLRFWQNHEIRWIEPVAVNTPA